MEDWLNFNFRTYLKRLCWRTICFSKSIEIHDKLIGVYIKKAIQKNGLIGYVKTLSKCAVIVGLNSVEYEKLKFFTSNDIYSMSVNDVLSPKSEFFEISFI